MGGLTRPVQLVSMSTSRWGSSMSTSEQNVNTSEKLDLLLNDIEMHCDPAIGSQQVNQFSIDCLSLIRRKLPPIAAEGLALTIEYLEGRVPFQSVTDMLAKCWQYLKENHENVPLDDPVV